jgi:hypothetical protein
MVVTNFIVGGEHERVDCRFKDIDGTYVIKPFCRCELWKTGYRIKK